MMLTTDDICNAGTLTFDYPTIAEASGYITDQLRLSTQALTTTSVGNAHYSHTAKVDNIPGTMQIAMPSDASLSARYSCQPAEILQSSKDLPAISVIGVSQQRAGDSLTDQTGMSTFCGYADSITTIHLSRWDLETQTGAELPARYGGLVQGVDLFDPNAFQISSSEALLVDPQQRLLLQVSAQKIPHLHCDIGLLHHCLRVAQPPRPGNDLGDQASDGRVHRSVHLPFPA